MTTTIPFISANAPQFLAPLEEIARGMVAAVKYYERHGIRADLFDDDGDDPPTEKESDDVRSGGKENQTDA